VVFLIPGDSAGPAGIFDSVFYDYGNFKNFEIRRADKEIDANVLYLTSEF